MEKYGFFGGSFNPVTNAHINLAKLAIKEYDLNKVIFIPMGNNYPKQDLIDEKHRYQMLKIATKKEEDLEVSDIELNLSNSLTMLQAFRKIEEKYKNIERYFIIGSDNLIKLINLKDFETLVKNYNYIIIEREMDVKKLISENVTLKSYEKHFKVLNNNPYKEISATNARNIIKNSESHNISDVISEDIQEYIRKNNLYSKSY